VAIGSDNSEGGPYRPACSPPARPLIGSGLRLRDRERSVALISRTESEDTTGNKVTSKSIWRVLQRYKYATMDRLQKRALLGSGVRARERAQLDEEAVESRSRHVANRVNQVRELGLGGLFWTGIALAA
jgi:hypothetical protein